MCVLIGIQEICKLGWQVMARLLGMVTVDCHGGGCIVEIHRIQCWHTSGWAIKLALQTKQTRWI